MDGFYIRPPLKNMAFHFQHNYFSEVSLYSLKLRETVTSCAEWYAEDNE